MTTRRMLATGIAAATLSFSAAAYAQGPSPKQQPQLTRETCQEPCASGTRRILTGADKKRFNDCVDAELCAAADTRRPPARTDQK